MSIAILYSQARWAAFAPLGVIFAILATTSWLGKPVAARQTRWLAATDKRIKLLSSVLGNIVPIKMSGYERQLGAKVLDLRHKEMLEAKSF